MSSIFRRVPSVALRGRRAFSAALPSEADVVVVGGGSIGASVFYHLQKEHGLKNVVLLERDSPTCGTTWHSAGMLWRLRPNDSDIILHTYTRELAMQLGKEEEDGGVGIQSFTQNGGLFIANNKQRLNEYARLAETGKYFDIESHLVSPAEAQKIHPLISVDDVVGALYSPTDGTMDPTSWVNALLKAGKRLGGRVCEQTEVVGIGAEEVGGRAGLKRISSVCVRNSKTGEEQTIKTPIIVNACGAWSRKISQMAGVDIPLRALKHAFITTESIPGMHGGLPNVRDHDLSIYLKAQGDALALGGYEQNPEFCDHLIGNEGSDDPGAHFSYGLFELDFDTFEQNFEGHVLRCPAVAEAGLTSTVCGPESFTPDHKPLVGPQPGVLGLIQACGFNSMGLMLAGGVGQQLSHWICKGSPEIDLFGIDCARFRTDMISDNVWVQDRTHESYAKTYAIVFPHDESLAGRGLRTSGIYDDLKEKSCVFQNRHGHERPGWFLEDGASKNVEPLTYDFYGAYPEEDTIWRLNNDANAKALDAATGKMKYVPHENHEYLNLVEGELTFDTWGDSFSRVKEECRACREGVAIFDQSYLGNFLVKGKDATEYMQWLCGADFASEKSGGQSMRVHYTVFCNDAGGCEADLTIGKISDEEYYVSSGGSTRAKDLVWMQQVAWGGRGEGGRTYDDLTIEDVGDAISILSIQGPHSRALLESAFGGEDFWTDAGLPFSHLRKLSCVVGGGQKVTMDVIRLTFVGELGYELHVPAADASAVYKQLFATAAQFPKEFPLVKDAGYRAIDSLSAEKGYRHWHADLTNADSPLEAGIGFTVLPKLKDPSKPSFKGREALEKRREVGIRRKLVCLTLSGEQKPLHGLETIWRDGVCVGYIVSTAYGHSIGKQIAYGYVRDVAGDPENKGVGAKITNKWLQAAEKWEIGDSNERLSAELSLKSPFDPKSDRVKGIYA